MTKTTPAPKAEPAKPAAARPDGREPAAVPMLSLLASCAAAAAVSTPPARQHTAQERPRGAA